MAKEKGIFGWSNRYFHSNLIFIWDHIWILKAIITWFSANITIMVSNLADNHWCLVHRDNIILRYSSHQLRRVTYIEGDDSHCYCSSD